MGKYQSKHFMVRQRSIFVYAKRRDKRGFNICEYKLKTCLLRTADRGLDDLYIYIHIYILPLGNEMQ